MSTVNEATQRHVPLPKIPFGNLCPSVELKTKTKIRQDNYKLERKLGRVHVDVHCGAGTGALS